MAKDKPNASHQQNQRKFVRVGGIPIRQKLYPFSFPLQALIGKPRRKAGDAASPWGRSSHTKTLEPQRACDPSALVKEISPKRSEWKEAKEKWEWRIDRIRILSAYKRELPLPSKNHHPECNQALSSNRKFTQTTFREQASSLISKTSAISCPISPSPPIFSSGKSFHSLTKFSSSC
ncbi:hypothetical protein L3X38_032210 [Prunus dulcis]|uniref:Uncharacterized protein n=1 Tax=Prunus dulcis TaxID=3755 RepID=A0AAD4YWD6_PRUDU|nr:hypothetical protein L3X38_032210 [Prunus dulcis]